MREPTPLRSFVPSQFCFLEQSVIRVYFPQRIPVRLVLRTLRFLYLRNLTDLCAVMFYNDRKVRIKPRHAPGERALRGEISSRVFTAPLIYFVYLFLVSFAYCRSKPPCTRVSDYSAKVLSRRVRDETSFRTTGGGRGPVSWCSLTLFLHLLVQSSIHNSSNGSLKQLMFLSIVFL